MIDVNEELIPLGRVPDLIPSRQPGKRLNQATVWRWANRGARGVLLETAVVGGGRLTSVEAVQRFVDRLSSGGPVGPVAGPGGRTPARRLRDSEEAARALEKAGA